ncbi:OsmC family peroxiredoxin [Thermococci archaeon]|nr:MAG: OsmC family peroxiredoxin [Thermococci archaeon]RLF95505.1 MAG: OsmC family peroxiredoxin [Thermococci archaeon]
MKVIWRGSDKYSLLIDEDEKILEFSESNNRITPMKLLLLSVASCTAMDVVHILKKMKEDVKEVQVEIDGKRREEYPRIYEKIEIRYRIRGDVNEERARRAVELSLSKYCSASNQVSSGGALISWSLEIQE